MFVVAATTALIASVMLASLATASIEIAPPPKPLSSSPDCANLLQVGASAADNYAAITACLNGAGKSARLGTGFFYVSSGIAVPSGATLRGDPLGVTVIILAAGASTNYVVEPGDHSVVVDIIFDAASNLPAGCCSAVISMSHTGVTVSNCTAMGQFQPSAVGVYFFEPSRNSVVTLTKIAQMHYGVIFAAGLTAGCNNVFQRGVIHDNECDSVTVAGYGAVIHNHIYNNGWNCRNGNPPIPGGGIYCLNTRVGSEIVGNLVENNCGMLLDNDGCSGFNVTGNTFRQPGNTFGGQYSYCQGSLAANLIDCSNYYIAGNTVQNTLNSNAVGLSYWGDSNDVFENQGAAAFSDLPSGGNTVLGFSIVTRPATSTAVNNQVVNNQFIADCSAPDCSGVGYFAGRGTGWVGRGGAWQPNLFTGNNPFGSGIGSRRCGGNWYAGDTANCPAGAGPPCNLDDYQHPYPPFRNDPGCGSFS